MNRGLRYSLSLLLLNGFLFLLNLFVGTVKIPFHDTVQILLGQAPHKESWRFIIEESRLPQAVTAALCGAALSVSGLMLQTAFRNPLAGPSVFGINNGAALGVALVMLFSGGSISMAMFSLTGFVAVLFAAFAGAMCVTFVIFLFSRWVRSSVMLLIIGVMIGYLSSSAISLLNFLATDEGVKSYMVWGMGSFGGVSSGSMPFFIIVTLIGLAGSLLFIKPLNILLLGEQYAESLGVRTIAVRNGLLLVTGFLTAVTTAFCGPVAFIGLSVPHIGRMLIRTDNHRLLMPVTMLLGAVTALFCNLACHLLGGNGLLPLNAITPLISAPVIIYVIYKRG